MAIFASPEFGPLTATNQIAIILLVSSLPVFAVLALHGLTVVLGMIQLTLLALVETAQWQFTRHTAPPTKLMAATITYLLTNLVFTAGVWAYFCNAVPRR